MSDKIILIRIDGEKKNRIEYSVEKFSEAYSEELAQRLLSAQKARRRD